MSLLIRASDSAMPKSLGDILPVTVTHAVTLAGVGSVQRLTTSAGETGDIVRLDNHITFHKAGNPTLHSRHDGKDLTPARMAHGLTHVRPAHAAHSSRWDAPCELTIVALTPRFLRRCGADLFKRDLTHMGLQSRIAQADPFLWCLGMKLDELAQSPQPALAFMDEIATTLAMHLLSSSGIAPAAMAARALPPSAVRRINDYVEAHLASPIRLADLAALCDLSAFHFARQFKRETGISPARYIRLRRMEEACRLLGKGVLGIDEIAERVGYQDASAFRRAFISDQGIAPSRFGRKRRS